MTATIAILCIFAGCIGFVAGIVLGVGAGMQHERARRDWADTLSRSAREASARRDHPTGRE